MLKINRLSIAKIRTFIQWPVLNHNDSAQLYEQKITHLNLLFLCKRSISTSPNLLFVKLYVQVVKRELFL
jgi:hypothetical protein